MSAKIFTSFLSVSDFLLAQKANYKIIKAVQSSSMQKMAYFKGLVWRMFARSSMTLGFDSYAGEMEAYEQIFADAFNSNLENLKKQARSLGANSIVDITIDIKWVNLRSIIISIYGSAAYYNDLTSINSNEIHLSTLSLNDTYKLIKNNFLPCEVLFVYTNFLIRQRFYKYLLTQNQENVDVSKDFNTIRQQSIEKFHSLSHNNNLEGVIGVDLKVDATLYRYSEKVPARIMLIHQIIGTGIKSVNENHNLKINQVYNLK